MAKNNHKSLKHVLLWTCSLLVFLIAFGYWLKAAPFSGLKKAVMSTIPIPLVRVNSHIVYSTEFIERLNDYTALKNAGLNFPGAPQDAALQSLINESKLQELARAEKAKLRPYSDFIDLGSDELKKGPLIKRAAEADAKKSAIKFWFYSQKNLNENAWSKAEKILSDLKAGADFGTLAKTYSDDRQSLALEGDFGPQNLKDMLFEIREPLAALNAGETAIIPSRLGLHVIQVYKKGNSENGQDVVYLKQIFLKGSDFESWVLEETKNYQVSQWLAIK